MLNPVQASHKVCKLTMIQVDSPGGNSQDGQADHNVAIVRARRGARKDSDENDSYGHVGGIPYREQDEVERYCWSASDMPRT